jgi:hypothetical protein
MAEATGPLRSAKPTITEADLKTLISQQARKQNFLAGHHAATHGIALTALAVGGIAARVLGTPTSEESLLGPSQPDLVLPVMLSEDTKRQAVNPSSIVYACRTCSPGSHLGVSFVGAPFSEVALDAVSSKAIPASWPAYLRQFSMFGAGQSVAVSQRRVTTVPYSLMSR